MEFVASGSPPAIRLIDFFLNPSIGLSSKVSQVLFLLDPAFLTESILNDT